VKYLVFEVLYIYTDSIALGPSQGQCAIVQEVIGLK